MEKVKKENHSYPRKQVRGYGRNVSPLQSEKVSQGVSYFVGMGQMEDLSVFDVDGFLTSTVLDKFPKCYRFLAFFDKNNIRGDKVNSVLNSV